MQPELHLFGITIYTFGIMFGIGFLVAGAVVARRLAELDEPVDWAYETAFAALFGGIVGARLWYVAEHWEDVDGDWFTTLFSGNGLVWYGGAFGGALAVYVWSKFRRMSLLEVADLAGPALLIGNAIGRVGCQLSGDGDYGNRSDLPWAMAYPDGTEPTSERVHPTPIYETVTLGVGAYVLWSLRDKLPTGMLFGLYLLIAGTERFLIEFIRRNDAVVASLSTAQLISLLLIAVGAIWTAVVYRSPNPAT